MEEDEDVDYIAGIGVESAHVYSVEPSDKKRIPKEIYSEMLIDDKPIKFQVDCGSSINILPKDVVDSYNLALTSKTLIMWNKTEVTPLGTARVIVANPQNKKKYSVEFVVVTEKLTPLIGARAAQRMKLLTIQFQVSNSAQAGQSSDSSITDCAASCHTIPEGLQEPAGTFPRHGED